jgi:hypothetical protein
MIELTEEQADAMRNVEAVPPRVVNPLTNETFVLIRADEYERLKQDEYDDSEWTRNELEAAAWDTAERAGWDEAEGASEATPGKP